MDPSHKTLTNKIRQAIKALESGSIAFIQQDVIAADLLELGCEIDKVTDLLLELLVDITPSNYVGTRPPQRSYEERITGCELYAFKVESMSLGCTIYFKYTLVDDFLWIISLHKDRPSEKE
ncbi:MAG: hypothetical protein ABFD82_03270 [Syntrophaceae bacterium]